MTCTTDCTDARHLHCPACCSDAGVGNPTTVIWCAQHKLMLAAKAFDDVDEAGAPSLAARLPLLLREAALSAPWRLELLLELAATEFDRLLHGSTAWEESARLYAGNAEFYRGLVREIGAMFGPVAYTSDDGSVQDEVLALKVPELVAAALAERAKLREALRPTVEYDVLRQPEGEKSEAPWVLGVDRAAGKDWSVVWSGPKGPIVGTIVHYYPREPMRGQGPMAAIVTRVMDAEEGVVNLAVFGSAGWAMSPAAGTSHRDHVRGTPDAFWCRP